LAASLRVKLYAAYLKKIHPTTGEEELVLVKEAPSLKVLKKWILQKTKEGYDTSKLIIKESKNVPNSSRC
jgi:hypothetical protein